MRVNVKRVIAAWREGRQDRRERSIWTDGTAIFSYYTCLAAPMADGKLVLNITKYSSTTSNKQSGLSFGLQDVIACTVDGLRMGAYASDLVERANTLPAAAERAARAMGAI